MLKLFSKINKLNGHVLRCLGTSSIHNNHADKNNLKLKLSYQSALSDYQLLPDTIGQRLDYAAEVFENREAYVFSETGDRLTFKTLKEKAENLASSLTSIGLRKGDRLGLLAPNSLEWVLTQFATALIGVIQVNINPAYKINELEFALKKVQCKAIIMNDKFVTQNYLEMLSKICPELEKSKPGDLNSKKLADLKNVIIISENRYNGCFNFNELLKGSGSKDLDFIRSLKYDLQSSDPINIQYTSGTTGTPKGVTLSHHMILNNAYQCGMYLRYDKEVTRILVPLPLYHCFAMVLGSLVTIMHGATAIFPSKLYNAKNSLESLEKEKCTIIYGTPTMFIDILNHPDFSKYKFPSLNTGVMGGATCPVEVLQDTGKKFGIKRVMAGYGMTEASPLITMNNLFDTLENRTKTIGRAIQHTEIKVVDRNEKITKINEPGELLVRGHNTMIGYWDDKNKTEETYTKDRFLKTGDLVTMNEQGYITFIGRLKDMVIRGGENIYPREIEEFLIKHPKIVDVYVIGVPDKRMGEELCACIKLVPNESMNAEELKLFCKDEIAHFKIPRYVEFMNEFPMTVTGKIQKNILQQIITQKYKL